MVAGGTLSVEQTLKIQGWVIIVECILHSLIIGAFGTLYSDSVKNGILFGFGNLAYGFMLLFSILSFIPIAIAAAIYSPFVVDSVSANIGL